MLAEKPPQRGGGRAHGHENETEAEGEGDGPADHPPPRGLTRRRAPEKGEVARHQREDAGGEKGEASGRQGSDDGDRIHLALLDTETGSGGSPSTKGAGRRPRRRWQFRSGPPRRARWRTSRPRSPWARRNCRAGRRRS